MAIEPITIRLGVDVSDAADAVSEFVRSAREQMTTQLSTATEKVKAKLDELARAYKNISVAIDENKQKINDLNAASAKATGDEKRRLEEEANALSKLTKNRELELLKIDEKRIKLQELHNLAFATTDAEVSAIKETTNLRAAENATLRDQARAHNAVTEEIKSGTSALQSFAGGFVGLQSVVGIINSVWAALERARNEMNQTTEAASKLRDVAQSEAERNSAFFNEFGLNTADEKKYGQEALNKVSRRFNITPSQTSKAAANLAPSLKASGVTDYTTERFESLVGTAGRAEARGIDTSQLRSVFQDDPNITGSGLETRINQVLGVFGGSASQANAAFAGYQANRVRLQPAGVRNFDDYLKLTQRLTKNKIAPEDVPDAISKFASAADKFAFGKTDLEKGELAMQLGMAGAGDLASIVTRPGPIDANAVYSGLANLDPATQDRAARVLGTGSRGGVYLSAGAGFRNEVLNGSSAQLLGATSPEEITAVQRGIARANTAQDNKPNPGAERFRTEVDLMKEHLKANPSEMTQYANKYSQYRTQFPNISEWVDGTDDRALQKQASQIVYMQHMQNLAGWKAANPGSAATIDPIINQFMTNMQSDDAVMDPGAAAPGFNYEESVLHQLRQPATTPTTRPTTRPTTGPTTQPTSINYHIRQTNYGASYDSIGSPESLDTRYS